MLPTLNLYQQTQTDYTKDLYHSEEESEGRDALEIPN